ncbi:PfkB domain protein [Ruegeria sp. TrichCH4B]|nr:PfkB domain protein [Ruegeria sp. TrichCH4B]
MTMTRPLATVGNVNVDLILGPVAPWPTPGTEVICAEDDLRVGGAAGNAALAWQAMDLPFQCAANTGDDHFGDWLRQGLGATALGWSKARSATTLSVGITHPDAERTFYTTVGHLAQLDWPQVEAQLDWSALSGGTLLLCGCFLTDRLTGHYDALFRKAQEANVKVALDTGWPLHGWTPDIRRSVEGWIKHSNIVLLNEIEAINLTQTQEATAALSALSRRLPQDGIAVIKRGPHGAIAMQNRATYSAAAPKVAVKDTIGAGDVFNAAFLAALARGFDIKAALNSAVRVASTAISTHPRAYSETTPQEVPA